MALAIWQGKKIKYIYKTVNLVSVLLQKHFYCLKIFLIKPAACAVRLFKKGLWRFGEPLLCDRAATEVLLATTHQTAREKGSELKAQAEMSFLGKEDAPGLQ